jgi:hypothetical protein
MMKVHCSKKRLQSRSRRRSLQIESLEQRVAMSAAPFDWTSTYLGTPIQRGNQYVGDGMPTILYDTGAKQDLNGNGIPDQLFKMYWLGLYNNEPGDPPPNHLHAGDRIFYAYSEDGGTWSTPHVVLKGQAGTGAAVVPR